MASVAPRVAIRGCQNTTRRARGRIPIPQPARRWLCDTRTLSVPAATENRQQRETPIFDTVGKALGELGPAQTEPRWKYTPPAMKAPFPIDNRTERREYKVNEDPAVLDGFYARFLGPQWPRMLPEELKWLAVTHKSFDQGRRGFNDRLAYFGRRAIILEVTKSIISSPRTTPNEQDEYGREPFEHPALAGLANLNQTLPTGVFSKDKVVELATELGLPRVIRWVPKDRSNLNSSGLPVVLLSAIQAIVGAVYLQHGAAVASTVVKDRLISSGAVHLWEYRYRKLSQIDFVALQPSGIITPMRRTNNIHSPPAGLIGALYTLGEAAKTWPLEDQQEYRELKKNTFKKISFFDRNATFKAMSAVAGRKAAEPTGSGEGLAGRYELLHLALQKQRLELSYIIS